MLYGIAGNFHGVKFSRMAHFPDRKIHMGYKQHCDQLSQSYKRGGLSQGGLSKEYYCMYVCY